MTVSVSFAMHETRNVIVGLSFIRLNGNLEECATQTLGQTIDRVVESVIEESSNETRQARGDSGGATMSHRQLEGKLKLARLKEECARQLEIRKRKVRHVTFQEFSSGKNPEWHFKCEPGKNFLEDSRRFIIGVIPDNRYALPSGCLSAETLEYLSIKQKNGKPIAPIKRWILMAKIRKQYNVRRVQVAFRIK
jgi:hypothetical protein